MLEIYAAVLAVLGIAWWIRGDAPTVVLFCTGINVAGTVFNVARYL